MIPEDSDDESSESTKDEGGIRWVFTRLPWILEKEVQLMSNVMEVPPLLPCHGRVPPPLGHLGAPARRQGNGHAGTTLDPKATPKQGCTMMHMNETVSKCIRLQNVHCSTLYWLPMPELGFVRGHI